MKTPPCPVPLGFVVEGKAGAVKLDLQFKHDVCVGHTLSTRGTIDEKTVQMVDNFARTNLSGKTSAECLLIWVECQKQMEVAKAAKA